MKRILLVDDDNDMLRLTERWLIKAGYEVTLADSGEAALDAMSQGGCDLVLLDYAMPQMDGPAVLRRMKELGYDIPVIFRTGMEDASSAQIMSELSPKGVVSKSDGKGALMKAVSDAIG